STGSLVDDRAFDSTTLEGDWTYRFNDRHLLSWGVELRDSSADYRYAADVSASLPIAIPAPLSPADPNFAATTTFEGRHSAVYLSYRARPFAAVTTELGLRLDEQSHLDDRQVSPRFNVLLDVSERMRLRASWGRYFQTQRLDELQINNGITTFSPAQESEHYVLGIEYVLDDGTSVRLEAYRKEIEQLDSRNENLFARVSLLPELLPDRVVIAPLGGESTGLELSADGERGRWRWWASIVRARSYDLFADTRAARSWEEPWSLKGGAIRTGDTWNLALTTTWHSGWPISTLALVDGELTASTYNAGRFGEFGSVDLKLSRNVELERSELEWYVSLTNVLARDNPCCIDYEVGFDPSGEPASLTVGRDNWLSIVPNVGVVWRFARLDP
ncbi:MAG TPA: TonB-dependent receptor, partial [Gammaproteobacteria bacterium]|nr:TonB-dependent receptor [Gammaproteobacteria bacterium]